MSLETLAWAKFYVSLGWSVIPIVAGDKRPALSAGQVTQYREHIPTHEEPINWFEETDSNIAVITGTSHGPVVVDLDSDAGVQAFNILTQI